MEQAGPNRAFEVKRVLEDGELVAIHSHVVRQEGPDLAVVHIFRFRGDRIVELWDVGQLLDAQSANANGPFYEPRRAGARL